MVWAKRTFTSPEQRAIPESASKTVVIPISSWSVKFWACTLPLGLFGLFAAIITSYSAITNGGLSEWAQAILCFIIGLSWFSLWVLSGLTGFRQWRDPEMISIDQGHWRIQIAPDTAPFYRVSWQRTDVRMPASEITDLLVSQTYSPSSGALWAHHESGLYFLLMHSQMEEVKGLLQKLGKTRISDNDTSN